ncbi:MAG: hypothetical protein C0P61_007735 [Bacillota bacterium]
MRDRQCAGREPPGARRGRLLDDLLILEVPRPCTPSTSSRI